MQIYCSVQQGRPMMVGRYRRWMGHMVGSGLIRLLVQHVIEREMAEIVSIIKCDADIMLPNRIGAASHVKVQYRYRY